VHLLHLQPRTGDDAELAERTDDIVEEIDILPSRNGPRFSISHREVELGAVFPERAAGPVIFPVHVHRQHAANRGLHGAGDHRRPPAIAND
jgi:hypothetical protein